MKNEIIIKNAKENNLKGIDLTIPRDKLVLFTGISGSGKSSLAFDTIFAGGTAPLHRKPVGLRKAVSRSDGQARRGKHRGTFSRNLHRPKNHIVKSPQHGGHCY